MNRKKESHSPIVDEPVQPASSEPLAARTGGGTNVISGAAAIVIGALLLLNVAAPAAILVLLAGSSLVVSGLIELSRADRYGRRPTAVAARAVFFAPA